MGGSEITTDMSCQKKCLDEGMVCGGCGPSCCGDLGCSFLQWKGKYGCTPAPAAFLARPSASVAGSDKSNGSDVALASAAFLAQQPASVDHIAEVANQSENVLEANLPITPLVCKQQGERCHGAGWCCEELECQNVHVGSEIPTDMSCQKKCLDEGMVCGGSGPSCCGDLGCSFLQWKGKYECTPAPAAFLARPSASAAGSDKSNGSDVALAIAAFLAQQPASVNHIAEVANQSENVLEANLPITPLVCKQQGERCHGAGWCCEELECQNVHVGSEITTDMSCQKKCLDEGMVCGGSGPSCCGDLGCPFLQSKGKYECTPP